MRDFSISWFRVDEPSPIRANGMSPDCHICPIGYADVGFSYRFATIGFDVLAYGSQNYFSSRMARLLKRASMLLLLAAMPACVQAQPAPPVSRSRDMGVAAEGIMGIVVNGTITTNGYEFYRIFTLLWSEKPGFGDYSLHIEERLSKRYGNKIGIYLGQKLVFYTALPLKYDSLHALCEKAVGETQANITALSMGAPDENDIVRDEL